MEKNDAWDVANDEIKALQEIIKAANEKVANQETELIREQKRGNELEAKIQQAQKRLEQIEQTEEDNKVRYNLSGS